jgi:hypothetical protein
MTMDIVLKKILIPAVVAFVSVAGLLTISGISRTPLQVRMDLLDEKEDSGKLNTLCKYC